MFDISTELYTLQNGSVFLLARFVLSGHNNTSNLPQILKHYH